MLQNWFPHFIVGLAVLMVPVAPAQERANETSEVPSSAPAEGDAAELSPEARAAQDRFDAKLAEYKDALREIELLRTEFLTSDDARRKEINAMLPERVEATQPIVDELVQAAMEAYRTAPNQNRQVTELLITIAGHYTEGTSIDSGVSTMGGQQLGGGGGGRRVNFSGGDQYEKALPVINLLNEHGAEYPRLSIWGFVSAFATADFDAAQSYLQQVAERGELENLGENTDSATKDLLKLVSQWVDSIDEYRQMWAREQEIRSAEAAQDDLPRVRLTTTKGDIVVELFENQAPQTVANFLTLVKEGFYEDSPFHRVLNTFMAQGGGKGEEGSIGPNYTIPSEVTRPDHRKHFRGSLSMALESGEPDSGNSQFFITYRPTGHLDGEHTVFGRVIEGMDVAADLQWRDPSQPAPRPEPDRILKAEVIRDRGHDYSFEKLTGP